MKRGFQSIKHKLLVFEKSISRKMFSTTEISNGLWRIEYSSELKIIIIIIETQEIT